MIINRVLFLIIITAVSVFSQGRNFQGGTISGRVLDSLSNHTIEYANVVLLNQNDSSQVTGAVTDVNGNFKITRVGPGNYYAYVQFIGYERKVIDNIPLSPGSMNIELGDIYIHQASINLDNVVVEGERSPISYQIDKKVIDPNQIATSMSSNAAEILENIPSITVDIEGNVSMRGSGNFTLLIDGRPSILDPQDALQQIPASSIENIEIITNPSAKYNPEGTAGIINIILKKNQNIGLAGLMNLNAGLNDKYGGEFLAEYKNSFLSSVFSIDYNRRVFPGTNEEIRIITNENNTISTNNVGDRKWGRTGFGLRGAVDFNLSEFDILGIQARYGNRAHRSTSNAVFTEWSDINPVPQTYNNLGERERSGDFFRVGMNYLHKFDNNGHELSADFAFRYSESDEFTITELWTGNFITEAQKTTEGGPSKDFDSRINYILPFSETNKLEAGLQGETDLDEEISGLYNYNPQAGVYDFIDRFSNDVIYNENEYALYSIYSGEWGNFGYQGGMRGEFTYREIEVDTDSLFKVDRLDYFPTLHFSYRFQSGQQLMASYTKRINRPRGWQLEPFITWMDANNVRQGNPALIPEYIDSYELGFQTFIADISFSTEAYYRRSNNKIEDYTLVYDSNVTMRTFDNVGNDYALGTEFMINYDIAKIWNLNFMGNLYDYRIEGVLMGESFSQRSFNWRLRTNNIIKISDTWQLQVNAAYISPSVSPQGRREGFFMTDLAVKKDFMDKRLSFTLQIRNLLNTAKWESVSQGSGFYTYNHFNRESPMVMLNMRYSINNYKNNRDRNNGGENEDDNGMENGF